MLGACLSLAAALGAGEVFVPVQVFTLAWMHSIEHVRWEEDYAVTTDPHTGQPVLQATRARIRGSAAGMEPPPDARLVGSWFVYTPAQRFVPVLHLTRSVYTADYDWCVAGRCEPLQNLLRSDGGVTELRACERRARGPTVSADRAAFPRPPGGRGVAAGAR
ncbi:MAG: DUF1850 domain-containing protein [Tibeticola sp.]